MQKFKIKSGDRVTVIAGPHRGATGNVTKILREELRVVVAGVNVRKRHTKPTAQSAGGIVTFDAPIHISNVAIVDPKTDKPTRVGYKVLDSGKKVRFAKKSGEIIDK
jgi:large subunit ribosomal protein L24